MATAGSVVVQGQGHGGGARRFAAACDVLSRYVKASAAAAAAVAEQRRPVPVAAVLPLMPGADLSLSAAAQQEEAGPAPAASSSQQLTISYGGQVVVVLDDVPADRAAELLRVAAAQGAPRVLRAPAKEDDDLLPVARKASLQRFMEKRKTRAAARGNSPYSRRPEATAVSSSSSSFREDHLALTL